MKKCLDKIILLIMICCFSLVLKSNFNLAFAKEVGDGKSIARFYVYDENDNLLAQRYFVEEGDIFITNNLDEFSIYFVDYTNHVAFARKTAYYEEPQIINKEKGLRLSQQVNKSVGIYMTHNDESFTPTDGYSSVYGKGGIHDVAKKLKEDFENLGYQVFFDETLHLPHDSKAYSRSVSTATKLLENKPDALFDIHRDGVARSVYVKNVDGVERCKVRIVVGQANPNKDANLQFAMYLVSVAKEYCPWLFLDIYYAKGHYNQELTSKGLLFEMGTYLAEKEIVEASTSYLAQVVDKTLFSTVVEDEETLVIKDEVDAVRDDNNVNKILSNVDENIVSNEAQEKSPTKSNVIIITIVIIGIVYLIIKFRRAKKS